jgi:hypothetical protein
MNESSYLNNRAAIAVAVYIMLSLFMLTEALGHYEDEGLGGIDNETIELVPTTDQIGLTGSWNLDLIAQGIQHLYLNLRATDEYTFGNGILLIDDTYQQVTVVGWDEKKYQILYIVTFDGGEMVKMQLLEEEGIISGEYEFYDTDGNMSRGDVYGSKIVGKIETGWDPFGIVAMDLADAIKENKDEKCHEGTNSCLNNSDKDTPIEANSTQQYDEELKGYDSKNNYFNLSMNR